MTSAADAQTTASELSNAGVWSARAANAARQYRVDAPNGRYVILVDNSQLTVRATERTRAAVGKPIEVESLAEVLWAPDARAFAVTQSDGGSVGTWSVTLFRVSESELQRVDIAKQVRAEFNRRTVPSHAAGCSIEEGNVGALTWRDGSRNLVLIAEAPLHSSGCDLGHVQGYFVDAQSGAILSRYTRVDLHRLFQKELGVRLR